MNRVLIINGKEMDLSGETKIGTTFQANNIGDLQSRQGSYTNTFKLPLTSRNIQNLEYANIIISGTMLPYKKLKATYIQDGVECISEGDAQITQIDNEFIHINIVSGNIDLVDALGDTTVGDLYKDDLQFVWNTDSAVNSRNGSKYYIFPFIDWRSDANTFFDTSSVDVRQMLPAARMPELFKRVEDFTGYKFVGNYIDSDIHKNMILTPDAFTRSEESINELKTKATFEPTPWDVTIIGTIPIPEDSGINYVRVYPTQNNFGTGFAVNNFTVTENVVGSLSLIDNLSISWQKDEIPPAFYNAQSRDFRIVSRIIRNSDGAVLAEVTSEVWTGQLNEPNSTFFISLETGNMTFQAGDFYYCAHDFVIQAHTNIDSKLFVMSEFSKFEYTPTDIIAIGSKINFRDIFRMKVKDVLKDVLNLRGIMIQTNSYTKEVKMNLFQDLVDNIPFAKKWSSKVDDRSLLMTFKFGNYAQKNWMRFKEHDSVPKELGDYYFTIENENFEKEKTVVQIGHSATEQKNKYLGYNIGKIYAIDQDAKWQKPTYRILQLETQNTDFNITFNDGDSSQSVSDSIPFIRFIGFELLIPVYYDALAGILYMTKGIKIPLKLTSIDISEIDHIIPIHLDVPELNINGYFYLNKIEGYKGDLTPCELIRM